MKFSNCVLWLKVKYLVTSGWFLFCFVSETETVEGVNMKSKVKLGHLSPLKKKDKAFNSKPIKLS